MPTLTALKEITDGRLEILNTPIRLKTFHFTSIYIHGNDVALKEKLTEVAVQVSESAMKDSMNKLKNKMFLECFLSLFFLIKKLFCR